MKLEDQAKSIRQKLSNLSQKQGVSYQYIATSFLLESLVAHIVSDSELYKSIIFKGGYVALRIYESTRYTIDLDALLLKLHLKETLKQVRKAAEKDIGDAVWFRFEKEINLKTQGEYGGICQVFRAGIGEIPQNTKRSQIVHFDLGTGDPVIPQPVKVNMSELVGEKELSWFVSTEQSKEQVLALITENPKITAVEIANTTNFTIGTIETTMNRLKKEGRIMRIGSARNGYWKIMEKRTKSFPKSIEEKKEQILTL